MSVAPHLSLVIPCYHEEPHFMDSVARITRTLGVTNWNYEIIFVDDGSTDRTRALIQEQCQKDARCSFIFHEKNRGRGAAFKTGFRKARGTAVGFIDIDLEVDSLYIVPLVQLILEGRVDVATGNRFYFLPQTRSVVRHVLSVVYSRLCDALIGSGLQDTETGIKFFDREKCAEPVLGSESDGWFWDTEVMTRAALGGYRIQELAVLFFRRFDKKSTVRLWHDIPAYLVAFLDFQKRVGWKCFERSPFAETSTGYDFAAKFLKRPAREQGFETVAKLIPDGSSVVELCCKTARLYRNHLKRRVTDYLGVESNANFVFALRRRGIRAVFFRAEALPAIPTADTIVLCSGLQRYGDRGNEILTRMIAAARKQVVVTQTLGAANRPENFHFTFETFKTLAERNGATRVVQENGGTLGLAVFEGRA